MKDGNINIEVGKTYSIGYLIKELEKAPEVRLGHIIIRREHLYHQALKELIEKAKIIKKLEKEEEIKYERRGKGYVSQFDVKVLSIIDPYSKYEKYTKFYSNFEKDIIEGILGSKRGSVAAPKEAIIKEAIKEGFEFDNEEDILKGMIIFFGRRGIDVSDISSGLIAFRSPGMVGGDRVEEKGTKLPSVTQYETEKFKEFYDSIRSQITEAVEKSKEQGVYAPIDAMLSNARQLGLDIEGKRTIFLTGLHHYFKKMGIHTMTMGKYVEFKKA